MANIVKSSSEKLKSLKAAMARRRYEEKEQLMRFVGIGESAVTAVALGVMRAEFADKDGEWNVGPTDIPWEAAIGTVLGGAGVLGFGGALADHMLEIGKASTTVFLNKFAERKAKESKAKRKAKAAQEEDEED